MPNLVLSNITLPQKKKAVFDHQLEGLRGLAALLVAFSHALNNTYHLDPKYTIKGIWQYNPPGHLSVLVFFMLSGYVIGLTNRTPIETNQGRRQYLKKRFVRIYPLYMVSIALAIGIAVLSHFYFSLKTIVIHLLFGQVLFTPVLINNNPLWSLNYEVIYYLFFLVFSAYRWKPLNAAATCIVLGIVCRFIPFVPPILASYGYGLCFWLIGVSLSSSPRVDKPFKHGVLLAFLLLMMSFERMNIGISFLEYLRVGYSESMTSSWYERAISFADLSYLVFCIPMLLNFTNRTIPGLIWAERFAFLTPSLYLVAYVLSGKIHEPSRYNTFVLAVIFYIIALFIYLTNEKWDQAGKYLLSKLVPLGSISYGIYIIHFPLIMLFHLSDWGDGSTLAFVFRCVLYLALVVVIGWVLERKLQPWARARIN